MSNDYLSMGNVQMARGSSMQHEHGSTIIENHGERQYARKQIWSMASTKSLKKKSSFSLLPTQRERESFSKKPDKDMKDFIAIGGPKQLLSRYEERYRDKGAMMLKVNDSTQISTQSLDQETKSSKSFHHGSRSGLRRSIITEQKSTVELLEKIYAKNKSFIRLPKAVLE